jgi:hypothetical protein
VLGAINSPNGRRPSVYRDYLLSAFRRGLLAAVGALLLALINPFNIKHWEAMRSQEVWEHFHAPLLNRSDQAARDEVSIVSLNEDTMDQLGLKRPLDMATHGMILGDILDLPAAGDVPSSGGRAPVDDAKRPKAVFVDLILSQAAAPNGFASDIAATLDQTPDVCVAPEPASKGTPPLSGPKSFLCYAKLVASYTKYATWKSDKYCQSDIPSKINCIVKYGGIPILFADETRGREMGMADTRSQAMRILDEIAIAVPVFISLPNYPLFEHSGAQRNQEGKFEAPADDERIRLTPASAIYAANYCMEARQQELNWFAAREVKPAYPLKHFNCPDRTSRLLEPLDLQWASGAPADTFTTIVRRLHPGAMTRDCSSNVGPSAATAALLKMSLAGVHMGAAVPDCPYVHDLPYQDLSAGNFSINDAFVSLGSKLVLVGEEFRDSADIIVAGPNEALPGVYAHAMALERLLADGDNYPRAPHAFMPWLDFNTVELGVVLTIFAFFFMDHLLSLMFGHPRHHAEHAGHPRSEDARHRLRSWQRLMIRLTSPFLVAGAIWLCFPRQFELSVVVVGGLVVAMISEIVIGSFVRWSGKRSARFAKLWTDIRAIFKAVPPDTSEQTPVTHQHEGGNS